MPVMLNLSLRSLHKHFKPTYNTLKPLPWLLLITRGSLWHLESQQKVVVHKDLSSVSIRTLLTVLNYKTSNNPLYVRFVINFLLWIYSPLY